MKSLKRLVLALWWRVGIPLIVAVKRLLPIRWALPDTVIIGVQKGGTTALFDYLVQHPSIRGSIRKEVHYADLNAHRPIGWYRAHFPRPAKGVQVIESSPYYIFHPLAPQRLTRILPGVRLIVLLRDPVARAYSHYQMMRRKGWEERTFAEAVAAEPDAVHQAEEALRRGDIDHSPDHQHHSYTSRGMYERQLDRWLEHVNDDQLLVLSSEALQADPEATLRTIYSFMGVEVTLPRDLRPRHVGRYPSLDEDVKARLNALYDGQEERLKRRFPTYRPPGS